MWRSWGSREDSCWKLIRDLDIDISSILELETREEYDEVTEDSFTRKIIELQDASHFYVNFTKDEAKLKDITTKLSE